MYINKIVCGQCFGTGHVESWEVIEDTNEKCYGIAVRNEILCPQCGGKGYTTYPVFTVEEAVKIAQHFGFDIEVEE